jgi:hypothetical protein
MIPKLGVDPDKRRAQIETMIQAKLGAARAKAAGDGVTE